MAKTRSVTFKVRVHVGKHGGLGDIPGLLDMLRYEGGQVVDWSYPTPEDTAVTVTIRVDDFYRHQPARWQSFSIRPMYDVPQASDGITGGEQDLLQARAQGLL